MRKSPFGPAWWFCLAAILTPQMQAGAAPPSSVYPDDSDSAESLIRSAQANVRDEQWAEAAEIYRNVLTQYGEKAIRLPDGYRADRDFFEESRRWVNMREFVLAEMAQWPEEGRKAFAQRTDPEAERIWRRANDIDAYPDQARAGLIKLATEFYLGSFGARSIEELGDMAFAAGDFEAAADWYSRLVALPGNPSAKGISVPALHPAPASSKALVAAKLVLAGAFAGNFPGEALANIVQAYAAEFPDAAGSFAGRSGKFAESLALAVQDDVPKRPSAASTDWPTFAGAASRNYVVDDSIDLGDRQWRTPVESIVQGPARFQGQNRFGGFGGRGMMPRNFPANPNRTSAQLLLAYHPVIVGEQVIVCTEYGVRAYNLNESPKPDEPLRPAWSQDFVRVGQNNQQMMSSSAPRMTLTAHSGRLFARLGESGINLEFGNRMAPSNAFIVALDANNKGQVLWRLQGSQIELPQPAGNAAPATGSIEGTPVADEDHLYLALTMPGHQTSTYIVALEAATGKAVWTRYVCDTPNPFDFQAAMLGYQATHAHHLLTLEKGRLFYQTDTGAVACLDARTGTLRWLTAYPKREQLGNTAIPPTRRDLNPVIYEGGTVYVAPGDSQSIFALDAETGEIRWKTAPLPDVIHLIGVAEGNLFATGDRVWTIEAASGRILRSWPDTGSGYEPAGRGLLAGRYLYWPTAAEVHILDLKTGLRSDRGTIRLRERFGTSGGNLALGDGFLVVAGTDSLSAFTQNTRLIRRYEQLIAATPEAAGPRYRLATAAESLGQTDLALQALREALKRIEPGDRLDGQNLDNLVRDRLFRLLLQRAGQSGKGEEAVKLLAEAESIAPDAVKRLAAVIRRTELMIETGQAKIALEALAESARDSATLNGLWAIDSRYETNISDLARRTLQKSWNQLDESARKAYVAADAKRLEPIVADGDRQALLTFLAGCVPGEIRARTLMALARASERGEDPVMARHLLAQAQAEPGLTEALAGEIRTALSATMPKKHEPAAESGWPVTLWQRKLDDFRQIVPVSDSGDRSRNEAFQNVGTMLVGIGKDGETHLIDSATGQAGPAIEGADVPPIWAGLTAGRGLLFDGDKLIGIDPATGRVVWRLSLRALDSEDPRYSPFAAVRSQADTASAGRKPYDLAQERSWWSIETSSGGVLLYDHSGQVWRVDAREGRILWTRMTDGGRSPEDGQAPQATLAGRHVLLREGSSLLVLDERTGELSRSIEASIAGQDWPRRPLQWDENRIVVTPDRLNVAMIDLAEGKRLWTWKVTATSPRNGPPRLFREGDKLVVIKDGDMAVRLDPANGKPVWDAFLGGTDHSRDLPDIALDDQRMYVIERLESSRIPGLVTRAYDLTDGSVAWRSVHISVGQSWAVSSRAGTDSGVMIWPDNGLARHFASGLVQSGESFAVIPSGALGDQVAPTVALLDRSTGRPRWRYASPVDSDLPWAAIDPKSDRIVWGSYRDRSVALMTREP